MRCNFPVSHPLAGDDLALNLRGAAEDGEGTRVEVAGHKRARRLRQHRFRVVQVQRALRLPGQGVGTQQAQPQARDRLVDLAPAQLEQGRDAARVLPHRKRGHDAQFGGLERAQVGLHRGDGEHIVGFEGARCAAGMAVPQAQHAAQRGMGAPGRDRAAALEFEQVLGDAPALPFIAQPAGDRHPRVVEEHLIDFVVAGDTADRPHRDARRGHVDQEKADALVLLGRGLAAAHQGEHAIGEMRVGGPDLAAVDHIMVAVAHRASGKRCQIGARARLGIALAPVIVAGQHARQVVRFLLRRAEAHDDRAGHAQARGRQGRGAGHRAFGLENPALFQSPAGAAMLERPGRGNPALPVEAAVPLHADIGFGKYRGVQA